VREYQGFVDVERLDNFLAQALKGVAPDDSKLNGPCRAHD